MDFDLNNPQKLLKSTVRDFLARECKAERVRRLMETDTAHDPELWLAMADQGWTGLIVPEAYGGLGSSIVDVAAIAEEMGRACLPGPFLSNLYATALIARGGSAEQKERWLGKIAAGELIATVAASNDFVGDAAVADLIVCVRDGGIAGVERGAPGVAVTPMPSMDKTRKLYRVELPQQNPRPAERGEGGAQRRVRGSPALQYATDLATVALCAEMVGGMQWVLDTAVEYAKTRQQFGRPIGSFQAVQHHCADMLLLTESARSATYYAAWAMSEDDPVAPLAVSMAKAYCSDAYREVGNRGIQVHGGIGFTWEHDLHLYYRRSKSSETLFGDAVFHRQRIARLVVDAQPINIETEVVAASAAE